MDNATTPPTMTLEDARKVLGTGNNQDYDNLLKCYQLAIWAAGENGELTPALEEKFSHAWRVGNKNEMSNQVLKNGKFVMDARFNDLDGVETCDACRGAGERFKFARKPVEVGCLKCKDVLINLNGKDLIIELDKITFDGKDVSEDPNFKNYLGKVVEDCTSCDGTGRYIVEDKEFGGSNNLQCKTCHGKNIDGKSKTTQIIIKCKTCKGKRRLKIPLISHEFESTTICRKCSGKGFVNQCPKHELMNPVISKDIAAAIKNL
jgi:DnaJ-class molecular chaperone